MIRIDSPRPHNQSVDSGRYRYDPITTAHCDFEILIPPATWTRESTNKSEFVEGLCLVALLIPCSRSWWRSLLPSSGAAKVSTGDA